MQTLALSLDCDGQETLRDRQKLALELVVTLVKLQERFKEEFPAVMQAPARHQDLH